jgi:DNA-binding HxlR family transcriptional regulator
MEIDGIVARKNFREVPPLVEDSLTPFGEELAHMLHPLCEWGSRHMKRIAGLPTQADAGE